MTNKIVQNRKFDRYIESLYYSFVLFIDTVRENDKENNYSKPYLG